MSDNLHFISHSICREFHVEWRLWIRIRLSTALRLRFHSKISLSYAIKMISWFKDFCEFVCKNWNQAHMAISVSCLHVFHVYFRECKFNFRIVRWISGNLIVHTILKYNFHIPKSNLRLLKLNLNSLKYKWKRCSCRKLD